MSRLLRPVKIWGIENGDEIPEDCIEDYDEQCFDKSQIEVFYRIKGQ